MKIYIDDQYMIVSEDSSILTLRWKPNTASLNDEAFKKEALLFANVVKNLQSKKVAVDMREFHFALSPELLAWRAANIITVYNQVAVEKFAFISDHQSVKQDDPNNTFVTRYVPTPEEAQTWLLSA